MATEEEIAERRQLLSQISTLQTRITSASIQQERLKDELEYVVYYLGVLDTAAQRMSSNVMVDVTKLSKKISHEEVDARDLLQLLRDVSERYFTYKNLSTATRNLTQYTDEFATKFRFYRELRRIALGCVMAVDTNLIAHETARKQVEKSYLANTDYWLAYAIAAVMLWWSDEREAAERAKSRALAMDERKSALFLLFCNLKFGRKQAALRWYSYYLGCIHANDVGEEFQYLLEAHLDGSFGEDRELDRKVGEKIKAMFDEIELYSINFSAEVADAANRFMQTKAHTSDFQFFYLAEYCGQCQEMKTLISDAEKNVVVAREYEQLAMETEDDQARDVNERLEDTIYNIIESMDPQEETLYRRIRYNELVVAAKGDVHKAEIAYAERYPEDTRVGFADLLKKWAFTEDDATVLRPIRRFAVGKLEPYIRAGVTSFAEGYRAKERDRYTIAVDGWSMDCGEHEDVTAHESFEEFYKNHTVGRYLKDRFILIWLGLILAGVLGLVIAAVAFRHPAVIVIAVLLVLVGAFGLWQQIENLKEVMERRKRKSLEIIDRTLQEMAVWRNAYHTADKGFESLMQALDLFKEDE